MSDREGLAGRRKPTEPASVLCAGHVNWDVTLVVDRLPAPDGEVRIRRRHQAGGGSAANVAAALAGLEHEATLFGSVGSDESGRLARLELEEAGVKTQLVRADGETAVKYLVVDADGEVMVLSGAGANEAFTAEDLPTGALTEATDLLHLTNQPPAVAAALAERARAVGATVSFAPGRQFGARDFAETLALADLVFCNRREAAVLLEEDTGPDSAGFGALRADATLVVTHGAEGSEVHDRATGRTVTHDGFAVEAEDTTGAGDAFAAGFLAARLEGADDERALAVANACGALAAREVGARVALSVADVESFLAAR